MKIGLIMRTFSPRPELVEANVDKICRAVDIAAQVPDLSQIDVLISADSRYQDSDCGKTWETLASKMSSVIGLHEVKEGDIFCGLLNYGVAFQLSQWVTHSLIVSPEAASHLTVDNLDAMVAAIEKGAKVAGLALNELQESILQGRIANTFALWDNIALMTVGGFDLMARKGLKNEDRPEAGCEEIVPLVRLVEHFGQCIAPIMPAGQGQWEVPTDPAVLERHNKKMESKLKRQSMHARKLGYELDFLESGVMHKS